MSVCVEEDNSILAFSAASFSLCIAMLSLVTSTPCCKFYSYNCQSVRPFQFLAKKHKYIIIAITAVHFHISCWIVVLFLMTS